MTEITTTLRPSWDSNQAYGSISWEEPLRIVMTAAAAALALGGLAVAPASAAGRAGSESQVAYGVARPGAAGGLTVSVRSAAFGTADRFAAYWLGAVRPAKTLKLTFGSSVDYRRITTACDLKETEGHVNMDGVRLGATRCHASDLTDTLKLGALPVRVAYDPATGAVSQVRELLAFVERPKLLTSFAQVTGFTASSLTVQPTTVNKKTAGSPLRIDYTEGMTFYRTSATCSGNGGVLGDVSKADKNGLGTTRCTPLDMYAALKRLKRTGHDRANWIKVVFDPAGPMAVKVYETAR
ncbi:hypothetical protein [Sphaerisporangium fuscum]|uniref:hypothetical protein n=1 Tax=Sphaerisporangium fuscum TaxID=2835868 RepID=UPI001BDCF71B|nr:hypothetical protein [Sphaerisporangium fuscum]